MAFKIKFRTQIFFGITLFFFVSTKNIFHIFFLIFDESMLINENLFPKSIKNAQKKKKNKKQNKTKSKFTTTIVNCHQQNYHHCHFHCQHYHYHHSTYIKYQLLCCRSQKKKKKSVTILTVSIKYRKENYFH